MKHTAMIATVVAALTLAGCANTDIYGGNVYRGGQAKEVRQISYGTIVSVRPVSIQARSHDAVGSVGGGILGGIAGSTIGNGRGSAVMSVVGALAGSLLGNKVEQKINQVNAIEMVIRTDNGQEIVVVQKQEAGLVAGKRVRLVGNRHDVNVSVAE